jgi:hypothetical protein
MQKYWHWASERLPNEALNKEVTFSFNFENISRLRLLKIIFMIPPKEVKLECSQDLKNWY